MATLTASPPTMSPPMAAGTTSPPSLPPLITSGVTPRRTSSQRPTSYASRRMSSYSSVSKASQHQDSRPQSYVFPAFHSSLEYTLVRDFAYPPDHPMHYGPPLSRSGMSTPASEARRSSDPAISSWDGSRGPWSATPPWMDESNGEGTRDQLPAMTFQDGGPPYEEDEDLHSPIVTASRHKKHKSSGFERGRSPGEAAYGRGPVGGFGGYGELDGPGDAVVNHPYPPQHRDSNFAKPLQRNAPQHDRGDRLSEVDFSEAEDEDTRFSKDYSFTIASPDEEMHGKALALFDFQSEHENELALKEGQVILVSYRHGQGWLVAEDPRTGESGLVPEEFVRLVRDIEGGLNGLNALDENGDPATLSPISNDPGSASTPTPGQMEFPSHVSRPSGEKHPPVQSTFSTSSKDFLPSRNEENPSPQSQEQT